MCQLTCVLLVSDPFSSRTWRQRRWTWTLLWRWHQAHLRSKCVLLKRMLRFSCMLLMRLQYTYKITLMPSGPRCPQAVGDQVDVEPSSLTRPKHKYHKQYTSYLTHPSCLDCWLSSLTHMHTRATKYIVPVRDRAMIICDTLSASAVSGKRFRIGEGETRKCLLFLTPQHHVIN